MEFLGYRRPDGSVGVRNHILVVAVTDCVEEVARKIASNVKEAVAVTQHYGCLRIGNEQVINILGGAARNPNVAAVLLVNMGCESLKPDLIADEIEKSRKPFETLTVQKEGGTVNTVMKGVKIIREFAEEASELKRELFNIKNLVVGAKCGGSDTTSGIAANPAVGVAVDMLIDMGATVILGEPIEAIGAENVLARRAANDEVRRKILNTILSEEKEWTIPGLELEFMCKGNIMGGLSTIEEKSLGAVLKGGTRTVQGVLENSRRILERPSGGGLYLLEGTHSDIPCLTNMAAAGAQIIVFTTGVGGIFGNAISPTIIVCGNPETYEKLGGEIDINAGTIIKGVESIKQVGEKILNEIVKVASGKLTKTESLNYRNFAVYIPDPRMKLFLKDRG
jgi:altronate dehydratase large subunit